MARRSPQWREGRSGLDDYGMMQPLGPTGGPYADDSMAALALHVSRETMHHGGEIGLLRDLYLRMGWTLLITRGGRPPESTRLA